MESFRVRAQVRPIQSKPSKLMLIACVSLNKYNVLTVLILLARCQMTSLPDALIKL